MLSTDHPIFNNMPTSSVSCHSTAVSPTPNTAVVCVGSSQALTIAKPTCMKNTSTADMMIQTTLISVAKAAVVDSSLSLASSSATRLSMSSAFDIIKVQICPTKTEAITLSPSGPAHKPPPPSVPTPQAHSSARLGSCS